MFRASPQHPIGPDGQMPLADHLRELRARLLRVALVLVVATTMAFFFYDQLFSLVYAPYQDAQRALSGKVSTEAVINGAAGPLLLNIKLCATAALIITSPYWLFQIWGFIVPGLHAHERKWTRTFALVAGPLFIAGVAVGYYVLPKGLQVLIGFTPERVKSLVDFGEYFSFLTRMLLVFGIAFEIPLFVVLLNLAGVVSGRALAQYRPWIIVGTFVFAAVATPSTDPFSMLMLALPMTALFFLSEVIARTVDRRRASRQPSYAGMADDQASEIEGPQERFRRSGLDEDDD